MLVFSEQGLAFLATPKTGSTAIEMALRPRADIIFAKGRKHMTAMRFHRKLAPFLNETYGCELKTFALMREPIAQIRSWYRYRRRVDPLAPKSTLDLSFNAFVEAVLADDPPPFAQIGSQYNFLTGAHDNLLVDHLFAYENWSGFLRFAKDRFGESISIPRKNVSAQVDAPLSPDLEAELRVRRAKDFALYDQIMQADGWLHDD